MKVTMNDEKLELFERKAESWVDDYYRVHTSHDVTLYMHVLAKHVARSIRLHGNLGKFSQQTFEKCISYSYLSCTHPSNKFINLIYEVLRHSLPASQNEELEDTLCGEAASREFFSPSKH